MINLNFTFPTECYSDAKLEELIENKNVVSIKQYINTYFFKILNTSTVLYWNALTQNFETVENKTIKDTRLQKDLEVIVNKVPFKIQRWFFSIENPGYKTKHQINQPTIYFDEISKCNIINMFPLLLHVNKERKLFNSYDEDVQDKVNTIWNHIKKIWCSSNEEQFRYAQLWIAYMVSGKKMTSAFYLKSIEGVGKSIIIQFLKNKVLGSKLVLQSSDTEILTGTFNGALARTMLFCLEEAPCSSGQQWKALDSRLKNYITEDEMFVTLKYSDTKQCANNLSIILNSNKDAVLLNVGTRRYFVPDVVNYKESIAYFDNLIAITNIDIIGEAFYFHCLDIVAANLLSNKKFNEQSEIPSTENSKQNINDNQTALYKYIKDEYVLNKIGINKKFKTFCEEFTEYCKTNKLFAKVAKGDIKVKLLTIGIKIDDKSKHHNQNWLVYSKDQLLQIFKNKNLINDLDGYESDDNDDENDIEFLDDDAEINVNQLTGDPSTMQEYKKNNKYQQEEIKRLNEMVTKLKTKLISKKVKSLQQDIECLKEANDRIVSMREKHSNQEVFDIFNELDEKFKRTKKLTSLPGTVYVLDYGDF